jgi:hypothetical protein
MLSEHPGCNNRAYEEEYAMPRMKGGDLISDFLIQEDVPYTIHSITQSQSPNH